jgi:hypothetical protein
VLLRQLAANNPLNLPGTCLAHWFTIWRTDVEAGTHVCNHFEILGFSLLFGLLALFSLDPFFTNHWMLTSQLNDLKPCA